MPKLANRIAKDEFALAGVCDLRDVHVRAGMYADLSVGMFSGIGRKAAKKNWPARALPPSRILSLESRQVRDILSVTCVYVQAELRGQCCMALTFLPATKQGIAVTRSFGHLFTGWNPMREAIAAFATRAAEKLRGEQLEVRQLSVFAHTNPHNGDSWYSGMRSPQIEPTSDNLARVGEATRLLAALWRPGFRYFKAGVILNDLFPARQETGMFATHDVEKSRNPRAPLRSSMLSMPVLAVALCARARPG